MASVCPSCLRPLPEAQTETYSPETIPFRSAQVCSSCGLPFDDLGASVADGVASSLDPTALVSADTSREINQIAHFQMRRLLGRGGFGAVWLAEDLHLGRLVALKLPKSTKKDAKLLHEAKTAARLKHPHIVSIFEVGVSENQVYIASEYIDGNSLRERIQSGRVPWEQVVDLLITVSRAVDHAHRHQVVHRDLKPENILLDSEGKPFVTDFGIAKQLSENETISTDGQIIGTVSYMSPEQAEGNTRATDRRSDVYALGTILFELLTEYRPFRGNARGIIRQKLYEDPPSPRKLVPNLPRDLETICLKCLQREPNRRYQSAGELADELQRFQQGHPIQARPISRMEKLWRWCKRNQAVAGLLVGVFFSLTIGLIGISYFSLQSAYNARMRQEALYRTRMVLASTLWQKGDIKTLEQTLEEYRSGEASHLRDFEWHYFASALKPYVQISDHGDSVVDVSLSHDGQLYASAGRDRIIQVWERADGSLLRTLDALAGDVIDIEFSPADERLVSVHRDGVVRLWNPREHNRQVRTFTHGPGARRARLDRTGKELFSLGTRGEVRRWDLASGDPLGDAPDFGKGLSDLCFAASGKQAAVTSRHGKISLWDLVSNQVIDSFEIGREIHEATFIDHDQAIASIGQSNSIAFTRLDDHATREVSYDGSVIGDVASLNESNQVAICSAGANLRVLNADRSEAARLATHALSPGVIDHAENSRMLVVGSGDGTVKLLDVAAMRADQVFWHSSHIRDVAFVDNTHVATCLGDGSVHLWDLDSGTSTPWVASSGREMLTLAIVPETDRLLVAGMQPSVLELNWKSGEVRPRIQPGGSAMGALSVGWDTGRIALGSRNGIVFVFDARQDAAIQDPLWKVNRTESQVLDLSFSSAQDRVIVAYSDRQVIAYDADTGEVTATFTLNSVPQTLLVPSEGDAFFVGTRSGEIVMLNVAGTTARSLDAHQGRINSLAIFPNGRRMVSAGRDQVLHLWDLESLELVGTLTGHDRQVFAVAVSPDGKCIASAGLAGDLRIWRSQPK